VRRHISSIGAVTLADTPDSKRSIAAAILRPRPFAISVRGPRERPVDGVTEQLDPPRIVRR
jgi:hypothetical protein